MLNLGSKLKTAHVSVHNYPASILRRRDQFHRSSIVENPHSITDRNGIGKEN